MATSQLIGIGLYTIAEASRFTGVPTQAIRRWLIGYERKYRDELRRYPPLWRRQLSDQFEHDGLGFLDLIELRFVQTFKNAGVSLQAIRLAAREAAKLFNQDHPFSKPRFRTDGRTIFAEIAEQLGEEKLLDLVRSQYAFRDFIRPSLYKSLEFDSDDLALRWYPMHPSHAIVIDPAISFGKPVIAEYGIRTDVIYTAAMVEGSIHAVSKIYEIPLDRVRQAIEYEDQLAA